MRSTIGLDDFDINLLKRPDHFVDVNAPEDAADNDAMSLDTEQDARDTRSMSPDFSNAPASPDPGILLMSPSSSHDP